LQKPGALLWKFVGGVETGDSYKPYKFDFKSSRNLISFTAQDCGEFLSKTEKNQNMSAIRAGGFNKQSNDGPMKKLEIIRMGQNPDSDGYFFIYECPDYNTKVVVPVGDNQIMVLRELMKFSLPRLLGYDMCFQTTPQADDGHSVPGPSMGYSPSQNMVHAAPQNMVHAPPQNMAHAPQHMVHPPPSSPPDHYRRGAEDNSSATPPDASPFKAPDAYEQSFQQPASVSDGAPNFATSEVASSGSGVHGGSMQYSTAAALPPAGKSGFSATSNGGSVNASNQREFGSVKPNTGNHEGEKPTMQGDTSAAPKVLMRAVEPKIPQSVLSGEEGWLSHLHNSDRS
jgi:hypothetical protein